MSTFDLEDIAQVLCGLDTSSSEPSNPQKSLQCGRNPNFNSANNNAKANHTVTFLTLPLEIRRLIYDLLLTGCISRKYRHWHGDNLPVDMQAETSIPSGRCGLPISPDLDARILRTCKQIYDEANPILYSRIKFNVKFPTQGILFLNQITGKNLKLIERFRLVVWKSGYPKDTALEILKILADNGGGLRELELMWEANEHHENCPGKDVEFIRKIVPLITKIQGLKIMVIAGFYGKNWPAYLDRELKPKEVEVRCFPGHYEAVKYPTEEEEKKSYEDQLELLKKFQEGTEDLFP
ncbi:hypothetical protein NHQ30_007041 [Ciborinia camelliae]|nr:hypothetical protein NHQ30_007041 [Ciborinia camelliae]